MSIAPIETAWSDPILRGELSRARRPRYHCTEAIVTSSGADSVTDSERAICMDSGQEYLACATLQMWTAYTLAGPRGQGPFFHNMMKSSIVHCGMLLSFTFPR